MKIGFVNGFFNNKSNSFSLYNVGSLKIIERLFNILKNNMDRVYFVVDIESFDIYKEIIEKNKIDIIFSESSKSEFENIKGFFLKEDQVFFFCCNLFAMSDMFDFINDKDENLNVFDENDKLCFSIHSGWDLICQESRKAQQVRVKNNFVKVIDSPDKYIETIKNFYLENNYRAISNGVSILDINNVYIDENVSIEPGVVIYPNNYISGTTKIKEGVIIYSNCFIDDSFIDSGCRVGPYSNLKKGSVIGKKSVVGAFVEIKNSVLKGNVKVKHHAYLGDGIVGRDSNIGCGVIFANYDGKTKNKTIIGNECFVGSNVTIVAPCHIGDNSTIAAGSTIVNDVTNNSLAIARSKQINKVDYYK